MCLAETFLYLRTFGKKVREEEALNKIQDLRITDHFASKDLNITCHALELAVTGKGLSIAVTQYKLDK